MSSMTTQQIHTEIRQKLTVSLSIAGAALGLSKNPTYEAARRGEIPVIKVGRSLRVPTAPLRRLLGIEDADGAEQAVSSAGTARGVANSRQS